MLRFFKGDKQNSDTIKGEKNSTSGVLAHPSGELAPAGPRILVIDSEAHDWRSAFGSGYQVEQAEWEQLMVVADPRATVHIRGRCERFSADNNSIQGDLQRLFQMF